MAPTIQIIGVNGLPEVRPNDNLGSLIIDAALHQNTAIINGDILIVTQKVISKVEGKLVTLSQVDPSPLAIEISSLHQRDPRHTEVVLRETRRIVRMDRGIIIAETRHGFTCANAGVDSSNVVGSEVVSLLPDNPDYSAQLIKRHVHEVLGVEVGVIISDTFGRPWREGATNVAIGIAGLSPIQDYRGQKDPDGYPLRTTTIGIADELASAGELVMGKLDRVPVAIVRGYVYDTSETGITDILRSPQSDLFR